MSSKLKSLQLRSSSNFRSGVITSRTTLPTISHSCSLEATPKANCLKKGTRPIVRLSVLGIGTGLDEWDKLHVDPGKDRNNPFNTDPGYMLNENLGKCTLSSCIPVQEKETVQKKQIKQIEELYKELQEERSTILAQNIKITKKKFDFGVFQSQRKDLNEENNHGEDKQNQFGLVGDELCIMKRAARTGGFIECNLNDEVEIKNKILYFNNLQMKGKYNQMIDKDTYKGVICSKINTEKINYEQLCKISETLSKLKVLQRKLNEEASKLYFDYSNANDNYQLSKDAIKKLNQEIRNIRDMGMKVRRKHVKKKRIKRDLSSTQKNIKTETTTLNNTTWNYKSQYWQLKNEIKENKYFIEFLEKKKESFIEESKKYYFNLLREGIDVRETGLSWIIYRLLELGADIGKENFPKFIDTPSYNYLMNYTKKKFQLARLNTMYNCIKKDFIKIGKKANSKEKKYVIRLKHHPIKSDDLLSFVEEYNKFSTNRLLSRNKEREIQDMNNCQLALKTIRNPSLREVNFLSDELVKFEKLIETSREDKDKVFSSINMIRGEMEKTRREMDQMRKDYVYYMKNYLASQKEKNISDCVKYDLLYSALFGNHAVV